MSAFSHVFLAVLLIFGSAKKSESLCKNLFGYVTCESMHQISDRVVGGIPGIREAMQIIIMKSSHLEVFPKAFQSAVNLNRIYISDNKNLKLHKGSFQNSSAREIYFFFNGIESIAPETFSNLPLEKLSLEGINLEEAPNYLGNLPLKFLFLTNNKIQSLENGALGNLSSLDLLALDSNKLQNAFPHLFLTYPQRLRGLFLHNNSLTAVSNYMLQSLTNLVVLNLGFNSISSIEVNSFQNTPNLKLLMLSNNHLKVLEQNAFPRSGMNHLRVLYLDNNKFMFLSLGFFARLVRLEEVTLYGNPWSCPCLTIVEKLLAETNVTVTCDKNYASGIKPICVNDRDDDFECRFVYNSELSEKNGNYRKKSGVLEDLCGHSPSGYYFFHLLI